MNKKIITLGIVLILMVLVATTSFAATGTVELDTDKKEVSVGDTFTITLKASSENGINGINAKYSYDKTKIELVSDKVLNSSNWSSLGGDSEITVICNSDQSIKSADLYSMTFKVKEGVSAGTSIKFETGEIFLDTDETTDSEVKVPAKSVEVKVKTGSGATGATTGTTKESTQTSTGTTKNEKTNTSTTKTNTATSNQTYASGTLPKTGINQEIIIGGIVITAIALIVFYNKKIKYSGVE